MDTISAIRHFISPLCKSSYVPQTSQLRRDVKAFLSGGSKRLGLEKRLQKMTSKKNLYIYSTYLSYLITRECEVATLIPEPEFDINDLLMSLTSLTAPGNKNVDIYGNYAFVTFDPKQEIDIITFHSGESKPDFDIMIRSLHLQYSTIHTIKTDRRIRVYQFNCEGSNLQNILYQESPKYQEFPAMYVLGVLDISSSNIPTLGDAKMSVLMGWGPNGGKSMTLRCKNCPYLEMINVIETEEPVTISLVNDNGNKTYNLSAERSAVLMHCDKPATYVGKHIFLF